MKVNPVADKNINEALYRRSVQFGDVPRSNDIKKWPFLLPFIPEPVPDNALFPFPQVIANGGAGWPVPAGRSVDIPILTEQDASYQIVNMKVSAYRGEATGSITALANAVAVVGVGTNFLSEYEVGSTIVAVDDNGERRFGIVAAVATNLALTLEAPFGPNAVTAATSVGLPPVARYFRGDQWYINGDFPGGIQVAGAAITGVGTAFTQDYVGRQIIYVDDTGAYNIRRITVVGGPLAATMDAAGGAVVGANGVAYKLGRLPIITDNYFRPLYTHLRVSMFIQSNGARYNMGGPTVLAGNNVTVVPSVNATAGGLQERPIQVRSIQGTADGLSMLYMPIQVAREGKIFVRVHNTHNSLTLRVNGTIFGYKVAV